MQFIGCTAVDELVHTFLSFLPHLPVLHIIIIVIINNGIIIFNFVIIIISVIFWFFVVWQVLQTT